MYCGGKRAGTAQSVLRLATGWKVRGTNPVEGFFAPVQMGHEADPASCTTGNGSVS